MLTYCSVIFHDYMLLIAPIIDIIAGQKIEPVP